MTKPMKQTESEQATPRGCEWCADSTMTRRFLSDDAGSTIEAENGAAGTYTLSHALDDSWWPCLAAGKEIQISVNSYDHLRNENRQLREALERVAGMECLIGRRCNPELPVSQQCYTCAARAALEEGKNG